MVDLHHDDRVGATSSSGGLHRRRDAAWLVPGCRFQQSEQEEQVMIFVF